MNQAKSLTSPEWDQFERAARSRRRDPYQLLKEFMRECLDVWEDQKLDQQISQQAKKSGRRAADSVRIVRETRGSRGTS